MNRLPECEHDIMMTIWDMAEDKNSSVSCDDIIKKLDRDWTKTTVLNFLTRLCNRGFLTCKKEHRINLYTPAVDKEDYLKSESESCFKRMHHGSLTSLLSSLYDGKSLSKDDIDELKKFIEETK